MMDEVWIRIGVVASVVATATILARLRAGRRIRSSRRLVDTGLDAGVFLFTSSACLDCDTARAAMAEALGVDGYRELRWGPDSEVFDRLGIEAVPATLIVAASGSATLYPGAPARAIEELNP